jgi:type I restriction enzyme S subunit
MNIDRLGQIDLSLVKFISRKDGPRLRKDDVLFNNTNSPQLIGKTAWIGQDADWAFSNHMTRLRTPDALVSKFVAHQLHYLWMTGYFLHRCVKHVNQASVSSTALAATVPMTLPPLAEQHRIVAEIEKQFTRLDASVAALKRAQANLKRYRASVLKDACEGRLVPTEAELARSEGRDYEPAGVLLERILAERRARWESQEKRRGKYKEPAAPDTSALPELPEGWVGGSLEQVSEIQGGIQKQPKRAPAQNAFPYLRVANVLRGSLELGEVHEIELFPGELDKLRLISGDLLIVEGNGSPSQIGRMAVWKGEIDDCVHQNHIIRARVYPGVEGSFIESFWNSTMGSSLVLNVASSTSGLYTLSVSKVSDIPVPLPPLAEQRRIVAKVERRLSVIQQAEATVEASLARAERLRQSILKQAFSGRLVPQDPDDEPASALLERIRAEREAEAEASRAAKGKSRTRRARKETA